MTPRALALAGSLVLVATVLTRWQVVAPVRVEGVSMCPTLRPGERALLRKTGPAPERGDVVALRVSGQPASVKRIVAVQGEVAEVRDAVLYVDDVEVSEPYVDRDRIDGLYYGPVAVGAGQLLVMGDARGSSIDSRDYGPVPASAVTGVVVSGFGGGDRSACDGLTR